MGIFDNIDPTTAALMAATAASSQGATRLPQPFMQNFANAIGAIPKGADEGQQLQMGNLGLERAKAMQPMFLNQIKQMNNPSGAPFGVPNTGNPVNNPTDAMFEKAFNLALMSGDMGKAADVLKSAAENSPTLAGLKTKEVQGKTFFKTANDTYVTGDQLTGGGIIKNARGTTTPLTPAELTTERAGGNPSMSPQGNGGPVVLKGGSQDKSEIPLALDGKPLLPTRTNLFKADPSGSPSYPTSQYPNTAIGQAAGKKYVEEATTADIKTDTDLTAQEQSLSTEAFRIDELAKIYREVQAGTLTAQNPEFFNRLAALGISSSPEQIKQLGGVQASMPNHLYQLVNQYKDINTPMGEQGGRLFGSVINKLADEGENAKMQPGALNNLLSQAKALTNRGTDMVKAWRAQKGLGNRVANGYTQRPAAFMSEFMNNHKLADYVGPASQQLGSFKGMAVKGQMPDPLGIRQ